MENHKNTLKKGDLLYCIKAYKGSYGHFEIGKFYPTTYVEECAVNVRPNDTTEIVFSHFHNKTCEHRIKNEDEWELDLCQLRINYRDKQSEAYLNEAGESMVTSCIGSAICLWDYFITTKEANKIEKKP